MHVLPALSGTACCSRGPHALHSLPRSLAIDLDRLLVPANWPALHSLACSLPKVSRPARLLRCAAALPALALEQRTIYPGSFTQIQVCAPIYVKVVPDTGLDPNSTYSVVVEGSKVVSTAIRAPVDNSTGTLKIMSKRDYSTKQPIKVTVFLPAAELAGVSFSGLAGLAIAPGFSPPSLTVEAGSGTGSIAVGSINTTSLTINTLG